MDGSTDSQHSDMAAKIARLVEERGWNQEDFARIANLNRHTVRQILKNNAPRRLRNATIGQCAQALGLQVNELRNLSLERLLPRMHGKQLPEDEGGAKVLTDRATESEILNWIKNNAERAAQITMEEANELLNQQGPSGAIQRLGMEHCVELIERKRRLLRRVSAIASTDYLDFMEQVVGLIFDKLQPKLS
jgi:transcriptional regulator with XRE-family HTH domain